VFEIDIERLLLSKTAQTGRIQQLISAGIKEIHFSSEDSREIFSYISEQAIKYRTPPSFQRIREHFPDHNFEITDESFDYLLDEFKKLVMRHHAIDAIRDLVDAVDDPQQVGQIDTLFLEKSRELATLVPAAKLHKFSDMEIRVNEYEASNEDDVMGIKMGIGPIDDATLGLQPHEYATIMGWSGTGKALALDTPIPTPCGWSTMGEIKIGDHVFDENGEICFIIAKTDILKNRKVFEVEFDDGTIIKADANHQWEVWDRNSRNTFNEAISRSRKTGKIITKAGTKIVTTEQINKQLHYKNGSINFAIKSPNSLQLPDEELPVDPYVLGIWLGDGHSDSARITCFDSEIIEEIKNRGQEVRKCNYGVNLFLLKNIQSILREIGILNNKHIPAQYFRSSEFQRLELVRGLMDSDGHFGKTSFEFTSTKNVLAEGFRELLSSLGIKSSIKESRATLYGKDCGPRWRVIFYTTKPIACLTRKLEKIQNIQRKTGLFRYIVDVREIETEPVQCIEVDSSSHLYLAGKTMIPTHNSTLAQWMLFNAWAAGKTPMLISLEMEARALFRKWDTMINHFDYKRLKAHKLREEEIEKWRNRAATMKNHPGDIIVMDDIRDFTVDRAYAEIVRWNPDVLCIDYITLMNTQRSAGKQTWEKIQYLTSNLKQVARTTKTPIIGIAQTNRASADVGAELDNVAFGLSIIQDSDLVLGLYQNDDMKAEKQMKVKLLKNRDGMSTSAELLWEMDTMTFGAWKETTAFHRLNNE
jgi:replicative DNA helicase